MKLQLTERRKPDIKDMCKKCKTGRPTPVILEGLEIIFIKHMGRRLTRDRLITLILNDLVISIIDINKYEENYHNLSIT